MVVKNAAIVALLFAFVTGCSNDAGDDMKNSAADIRDDVKVTSDHVWNAQVKALDKAKHVSQDLLDAAEEQRQAIEMDSH